MEKIDILLWAIGGGFAVTFGALKFIYDNQSKRSDGIEKRIDGLENKIDKLDEKVTDIDRRLCRLEGAFSAKDCCKISDNSQMRKAE